jgi:hypothetical protein
MHSHMNVKFVSSLNIFLVWLGISYKMSILSIFANFDSHSEAQSTVYLIAHIFYY